MLLKSLSAPLKPTDRSSADMYQPKKLTYLENEIWSWKGRLFTLTFVQAGGRSSLVIWQGEEALKEIRCGLRAADLVAMALETVEQALSPAPPQKPEGEVWH